MATKSVSRLPAEPLPWRPNTRPKLPPGALLDIDQGPLWDILTEWLHIEDVCHLDSALCQKSRRRRAEWLTMLSTSVLLFNREEIRVLSDTSKPDQFTHRALGAAALIWVLKRGINLATIHVPWSSLLPSVTEQESTRDAVISLAEKGRLDKLETIIFSHCDYIKDADLTVVLSKCYGSVKSIDIRRCDQDVNANALIKRCTKLEAFAVKGNESAAEMAEIFQSCRKLRKVDLRQCKKNIDTDEIVNLVANHCSLLEHLNLAWCLRMSDAAVSAVAESCPLLKFINLVFTSITDTAVVTICNRYPYLKRLFLGGCHNLTDAAVLAIAERLPGISHIDLHCITAIASSSAVVTLVSKCRELEFIDLAFCPNISDATIIKIVEHCSTLRELHVYGCDLTDAAVLAVAERLSGLTHINISYIAAITSSAVETLASKCRELKYINLSKNPNISDVTLTKIAEHCSKLVELCVYECPNVTYIGLKEIFYKCTKLKSFQFDEDIFDRYEEEYLKEDEEDGEKEEEV